MNEDSGVATTTPTEPPDVWRTGVLTDHIDERGRLVPVDLDDFEMPARRFFWITDVPSGATRAGHGHRTTRELIFVMVGAVTIDLITPQAEEHSFVLSKGEYLYLPARHVIFLREFAPETIVGVLASEPYDPGGMIIPKP